MKKSICLSLLTPFIFVATSHNVCAQNSQSSVSDLVARSAPAVVTIKTFDANGQAIGLGSGFRVSAGRLVTNAHVVAGASRIEVFDSNEQLLGTASFAEAVSTTVDLAILPRLGAASAQLSTAAALPPVGERVVVIGAPEGLANTVSDGLVSAIRSIDGRSLLQISAPISPGSSGGPVLNSRGEVIGVSVSMLREGQNLNFAVPLTDLVAMLASPAGRVGFPPAAAEHGSNTVRGSASRSMRQVQLGESIDGSLSPDDQTLGNGTRFDAYNLHLTAGTRVMVSVRSSDFDSYVYVFQRVGDSLVTVASDDDSGGGVDAEANFVAPETGSYMIDVLSASSRVQSGDYTLRVQSSTQSTSAGSLSSASDGERWVETTTSSAGTFAYDRTRIQPMGSGVYRIWTRRDVGGTETNKQGETYDHTLTMDDVDCRGARVRLVQVMEYLRGKVVYSSHWDEPADWGSLVPESIGEVHYLALCRYVAARGL